MRIDIYNFMLVYLGALLVWGAWQAGPPAGGWIYLVSGILIAAVYALADVLWTYFRDRVWYQPWASVISGFIIALVGLPNPSWELIILLPLTAVALKQLVKIRTRRHIFNPAASALAVAGLGGFEAVSWWVPSLTSGGAMLWVMLLAGLYIIYYLRRWETVVSFLIPYGLFFGLPKIFDGTLLFFTSVMLIEHVSSNFPGRRNRIIYGALVGIFAIFFTFLELDFDPLIGGLLAGNLIMSVLTLLL